MSIDRTVNRSLFAALLIAIHSVVIAAPRLDPMQSSHAVLQRGQPLQLRGTAAAGERVTVSLAGVSRPVRADARGRWSAEFPALPAGGPFRIEARGADGSLAIAEDVTIGDVWLCSGQSNMEFPLQRAPNADAEVQSANDSQIRIMKIQRQSALDPQADFLKVPSWKVATPDTAKDFSAACYFMIRDLRKRAKVAIGAIDDTWGGTPIRAWTDEQGARASGGGDAADLVVLFRRDRYAAARRFGEQWGAWWRSQSGDAPGREPWNASDRLAWKPLPGFTYWDNWGPEFAAYDGAAWARRTVELTPAEAAQGATLTLGVIDDLDLTFVNGVAVGSGNDWETSRSYPIAPGLLRAGSNEILVYVRDEWGPGGFQGPADKVALRFADGHSKPLGEGWGYALIANAIGSPPLEPWEGLAGVGTIHHAMIAPLGRLGLAGVAWYQGEADVGQPGYDRRLAAMMAGWRRQFGAPELPFLIVGLAGWGKPVSAPGESPWAVLIDEQRKAVAADQAAALVSAIDLGEWRDIHPTNKQEVGRRLALAARGLAYRDPDGALSSMPLGATRTPSGVSVRFSKPVRAVGGAGPAGFELCGATQASCRFRDGRANGDRVEIAGDGLPVTRVRYAWADYPTINLYDADLLPVPVFELPVR